MSLPYNQREPVLFVKSWYGQHLEGNRLLAVVSICVVLVTGQALMALMGACHQYDFEQIQDGRIPQLIPKLLQSV